MVITIPVKGYFWVNTYIYGDKNSRQAVLIDPGAEAERILAVIKQNNLTVEAILLTHGHFDHLGAADLLHRTLKIPICLALEGRKYAENPQLNLSAQCGQAMILPEVQYFNAQARPSIQVGNRRLWVLPTPGHTPDSVVYYAKEDEVAFVGDTIFQGSIGTTQFPGGNDHDLRQSIQEILRLPKQTRLFSGHSQATTVAEEAENLRFLLLEQ